jgi:hypothetical protein
VKNILLIMAAILAAGIIDMSRAQQAAPPIPTPQAVPQNFVPATIKIEDWNALMTMLQDIPMKYGLPILLWAQGLENKAANGQLSAPSEAPK